MSRLRSWEHPTIEPESFFGQIRAKLETASPEAIRRACAASVVTPPDDLSVYSPSPPSRTAERFTAKELRIHQRSDGSLCLAVTTSAGEAKTLSLATDFNEALMGSHADAVVPVLQAMLEQVEAALSTPVAPTEMGIADRFDGVSPAVFGGRAPEAQQSVCPAFPLGDLGRVTGAATYLASGDEIRGMEIQAQPIDNPKPGYELRFRCSEDRLSQLETRLSRLGASDSDHFDFFRQDGSVWPCPMTGLGWETPDGKAAVDLCTGKPEALRGTMRVRVFGDAASSSKTLQALTRRLGLGLAAPSRQQLDAFVLGRFLSSNLPDVGALPDDLQKLRTLAEDQGFEPGRLDRLRLEQVTPGRFEVVDPGLGEICRDLGVRFLYSSVWAESLPTILREGQKPLLDRLHGGLADESPETTDMETGGAQCSFTRMVLDEAVETGAYLSFALGMNDRGDFVQGGDCALMYEPELLERLDWWSFPKDEFGRSNGIGADHRGGRAVLAVRDKAKEGWAEVERNEQMFPGGIGSKHLRAIWVRSEEERESILTQLRDEGIDTINERPIEDVVVFSHSGLDLF